MFSTSIINLTHKGMLEYMPWYSGWLDDGAGKPDSNSVLVSSILTMTHPQLPTMKLYIN